MFMPGGWEWIVVATVALIVFGPKRLPEIGRQVGKGMRAFKDAAREIESHLNINDFDSPPPRRSSRRVDVPSLPESPEPTQAHTEGGSSYDPGYETAYESGYDSEYRADESSQHDSDETSDASNYDSGCETGDESRKISPEEDTPGYSSNERSEDDPEGEKELKRSSTESPTD